jgi:hypothetical protein
MFEDEDENNNITIDMINTPIEKLVIIEAKSFDWKKIILLCLSVRKKHL